jgi:hypothetical protein
MENPREDQGRTLWVVNTLFVALAAIAVLGHVRARQLQRALRADD